MFRKRKDPPSPFWRRVGEEGRSQGARYSGPLPDPLPEGEGELRGLATINSQKAKGEGRSPRLIVAIHGRDARAT